MPDAVRILFVGDIVGSPGRQVFKSVLPRLRERYAVDLVFVNGENAAAGHGITSKVARELLASGADAITLGNHTYRLREVYPYLDEEPRILRPYNFQANQPGHGTCVVSAGATRVGLISLSGNVFMDLALPALPQADAALRSLQGKVDQIIVDFHAEATSEKVAMGWYLDGRVAAVVGTHTHVQTADSRVLPGGTAYITDLGMTGARGGILGVRREQALGTMLTRMPNRFEPSDDDLWLHGAVIETAPDSNRALAITAVAEPLTPAQT
jgi:metallophosphoesterase (TIGR00282 family)